MNTITEAQILNEIIEDAMEQTSDRDEAASIALKMIHANAVLYNALSNDLINNAVREAVSDWCYRNRRDAWNKLQQQQAANVAGNLVKRINDAVAGKRTLLMEMVLSKGRLGDYTAQMLREEAKMYRAQAKTMLDRAYWFSALSETLPDETSKVRDTLDEQALTALLEKSGG